MKFSTATIVAASMAIGSVTATADFEERFFATLLRRQEPGSPKANCHDNCGSIITQARTITDSSLCSSKAFNTNYANCLQCAGPDNEDIWKYYGNSVSAAGTRCGKSTTPLSGPQDDVPAAIKDAGSPSTPSATPTPTPTPSPSAEPSKEPEPSSQAPASTPAPSSNSPASTPAPSASAPAASGTASSAAPASTGAASSASSPASASSSAAYGSYSSTLVPVHSGSAGTTGSAVDVKPTGMHNGTVSVTSPTVAVQTVNAAGGLRVGGVMAVVMGAVAMAL